MNQLVRFRHKSGTFVDITADRGQWRVDIGLGKWGGERFDVEIWEACLSGHEAPSTVVPLKTQIHRITAVAESAPTEPVTLDCLVKQRRRLAEKILGHPVKD